MNTRIIAAALAASAFVTGTAFAQTTASPTSAPVKKPGLLSRILHRNQTGTPASSTAAATGATTSRRPMMGGMTTRPMMGGTSALSGTIVGNKNTLVYHMAGDHNLPAPKNRVYFKTIAQAETAGYHAAGTPTKTMHAPMTRSGRGYHAPSPGVMGH